MHSQAAISTTKAHTVEVWARYWNNSARQDRITNPDCATPRLVLVTIATGPTLAWQIARRDTARRAC